MSSLRACVSGQRLGRNRCPLARTPRNHHAVRRVLAVGLRSSSDARSALIWTAWNNGRWHSSGAGYGFKIRPADRDQWFSRQWLSVVIDLPSSTQSLSVTVNVNKPSFWSGDCRELINRAIGQWLISQGHAPWPAGSPPKFDVRRSGTARFKVMGVAA